MKALRSAFDVTGWMVMVCVMGNGHARTARPNCGKTDAVDRFPARSSRVSIKATVSPLSVGNGSWYDDDLEPRTHRKRAICARGTLADRRRQGDAARGRRSDARAEPAQPAHLLAGSDRIGCGRLWRAGGCDPGEQYRLDDPGRVGGDARLVPRGQLHPRGFAYQACGAAGFPAWLERADRRADADAVFHV